MGSFLLRRLAWGIVVLGFVVTGTFALTHLLPGNPARAEAGPHATADTIERIGIQRGYFRFQTVGKDGKPDPAGKDKKCIRPPGKTKDASPGPCERNSILTQYRFYLGKMFRGDLGESVQTQRPVLKSILDRLPATALLALGAVVVQIVFGVGIGLFCALFRNRPFDWLAMAGALVGISAPTFFVGLSFLYVLAYAGGFFPIGGYGEGVMGRLWHLVLPALTLGVTGTAYYARLVRSEMIEVLELDYIRTARAKGLSPSTVIIKHALRNALMPVVTLLGLDLGVLLGGAIITESVFAWPGIGHLAVQAILQQDNPVIMGTVIFSATVILVMNLLVDLAYAVIDPRIRVT